jgi:hypothetical protein
VTIQPRPGPGEWHVELCATSSGQEPFNAFLASLNPYQLVTLKTAVDVILARQGHNVCETEWGRSLGGGLYEFRVRRSLATICKEAGIDVPAAAPHGGQVLLRVFFAVYGNRIVLLLGGYDKGADTSPRRQQKEIHRARSLLKAHQRDRRSAHRRSR